MFIIEVAWTLLLLLVIRDDGLKKKLLKSSAFSLKCIMKWFSWHSGGISGIFLLFRNIFINVFILLLNHGGSLSLHTIVSIVSWGIKLLRMLRTVLLKKATFALTLVFKKTLCQSNFSITLFINSVFASL